MSPSGGAMTTVDPCMTWSPEKSICSFSSIQHRWFEAWPGSVQGPQGEALGAQLEAVTDVSGGDETVAGAESEHLGPGALARGRPRPARGRGGCG